MKKYAAAIAVLVLLVVISWLAISRRDHPWAILKDDKISERNRLTKQRQA